MRELTVEELTHVSGGDRWDFLTNSRDVARASRFAASLGLVYGSFEVGFAFGTWLYDNGVGAAWNRFLDERMAN
ncbi:MAG: hypothetical protein ACREVN_01925 [Gammaproteobacteria bacterium]